MIDDQEVEAWVEKLYGTNPAMAGKFRLLLDEIYRLRDELTKKADPAPPAKPETLFAQLARDIQTRRALGSLGLIVGAPLPTPADPAELAGTVRSMTAEQISAAMAYIRDPGRTARRGAPLPPNPPTDGYVTVAEYSRRSGVPTKRTHAAIKFAGLVGRPRGFDPATKFPRYEYLSGDIDAVLSGRPGAMPKGWGGKREGAGRPRGSLGRPRQITTEDAAEWARKKMIRMRAREKAAELKMAVVVASARAALADPLAAAWAELEHAPVNSTVV